MSNNISIGFNLLVQYTGVEGGFQIFLDDENNCDISIRFWIISLLIS